jgi:hypothetical protein
VIIVHILAVEAIKRLKDFADPACSILYVVSPAA